MIVAALLVAALSVEPQVFPEPLCGNLPEVRPEVKTWVAHVAPELAQVQVHELPEKTALDVFGRAAVADWGSIDVLTHSVFREPCTFYFSREALRAVDAAFVLDLMTVIRGQDQKGQDFEMAALGWPATSGSRPGSNSTRRLPVFSKMFRGSAPKFRCWVACASAPL
jgi:hypothetical protein